MQNKVDIRCIWDAKATLGESPLWVAHEKALYWVDIKGQAIYRIHVQTGEKARWPLQDLMGCLVYSPAQGFLAGLASGFARIALGQPGEPPEITMIGNPEPDLPDNRFNDGKLDDQGRFIAGTMDNQEERVTGSWYRLDIDGQIHQIDTGYKVTNGPVIDERRGLIYLTDSAKQTIYVAKYLSSGDIADKQVFKQFGDNDGYPDGMTVDDAGNLWVAFWDGACVRQFSPSGEFLQVIEMPVPRPTSVTFADDPSILYVTSARIDLTASQLKEAPLSGGVFSVKILTS